MSTWWVPSIFCFSFLILFIPPPNENEVGVGGGGGGYTGFTLSVRPSVRPSVCRRHGFRSISQVCFGISIWNFICILMVVIGRSGDEEPIDFQRCHFQNGGLAAILDFFNFSLALIINSKLQLHNTVKCHYNACHYNANASLTRSILGSQTAPTSWDALMSVPEWLSTWAKGVKSSRSDRPQRQWHLFVPIQMEQNVSHLLVMSIQSLHDWSSIKHTDYSSPMLWECHHSANMAARRPDVENNPGSNQVNISLTHVN